MKNQNGFTLIEALISLALSGIIIMAALSLLVSASNVDGSSVKASQQIELVMNLNSLRDKLTNIPKLHPAHDLYNPGDKLYYGITDIRGENDLKNHCKDGHALIFTITDTTKDPAKTIRFWNENNLATGGTHKTLVIDFDKDTTDSKSFPESGNTSAKVPKELLAIDADGKIKRNYIITNIKHYRTPQTPNEVTKDPHPDPHVAITVQLPKTFVGAQDSALNSSVSLVTESLLYPSESFYVCLDKDTHDLIQGPLYEPDKKVVLVKSGGSGANMALTKFETEFIGTRADKRLNADDYFKNLPEAPSVISAVKTKTPGSSEYEVQTTRECMNTIRITIEAELSSGRTNSKIETVTNRKSVFINNLMPERPVKCQEGT